MSLSLRSALAGSASMAALAALPRCENSFCPRPPSLWQRWWARHEGTWLEDKWYCSPDCFYDGLCQRLENMAVNRRYTPKPNRLPLGLVMLAQGEITSQQLRQALAMQRTAGSGRIGQWLLRMGAVSEEQVTNALARQQCCPVFASREPQPLPPGKQWPQPLAEIYRAVPVFYNPSQSALFVGFLEQVDHAFLCSVEQMLRCRTEPCIVPPSVFASNQHRQQPGAGGETILIRQRQNSIEMARAISNYARQVRAGRCVLTSCGGYLWIRLLCIDHSHVDFLFRSLEAPLE